MINFSARMFGVLCHELLHLSFLHTELHRPHCNLGAASSIYMCSSFCFAWFLSMRGGFGHQMQEGTNILPKIGRRCIVSQWQELALHPLYLLIHNVQGNEDMVMVLWSSLTMCSKLTNKNFLLCSEHLNCAHTWSYFFGTDESSQRWWSQDHHYIVMACCTSRQRKKSILGDLFPGWKEMLTKTWLLANIRYAVCFQRQRAK